VVPLLPEMQEFCVITQFSGEYRWLSNFWRVPVTLDGCDYPSVENAYQAAKTRWPELREAFQSCSPGLAKRMGQDLALSSNWSTRKLEVMKHLIRQKFLDPEMATKLLATGDDEIIEGNTWGDTFWGVCNGEGSNRLGVMIMQMRHELRVLSGTK
jgi:ribA/ribD-fused uncharacterized protein